MFKNLLHIFLSELFILSAAYAQQFDNNAVISLQKAGLGEGIIITKIISLPCGYDVSTDGLIALKKAGVTDNVIAAMVDRCAGASRAQGTVSESADPLVKRTPGIYLFQDWLSAKTLIQIRPAINSGMRTTGNGSLIFPLKQMLQVPTLNSQNIAHRRRPIFYFYFKNDDKYVSDFGIDRSLAAQSPTEFNLIRFKVNKSAREIEVGRASQYFSVDVRNGVSPKDVIAFSTDEIGDGIFKVMPTYELAPGEYAFVFAGEKGRSRVYDFAIDGGVNADVRPGTK